MTLIGIIIALLLEHMLSHVARWREHAWFMRYATSVVASTRAPRLWNSAWGLALLLLPLLLGVALIQAFFHGGIFTLLGLPFSVAILLLCLGPRDVAEEVQSYFDAKLHGDTDTVARIEHDFCSGPAKLKGRGEELMIRGLLVQSHERLFGVLLWFFVAGPVGAVLYRTAAALPRVLQHVESGDRIRDWALRLHALVAWVPVRIVALIYGLAGSTDDAIKAWRVVHTESADDWMTRTWRLLTDVGAAALQMEDDDDGTRPVPQSSDDGLQAALGLVQRSLLILLAVLAVFTLGGWLS